MEKFSVHATKARHNIRVADHMLTMTYPLVKDPKILVSVLENTFSALSNSLACVLHYERTFKRIPSFHETFESKFNLFKAKIVPRYKLDIAMVRFITEVKELVDDHRKSSMEFSRKGKYFMADSDYRIKSLSPEGLKKKLKRTKEITHVLLQLVNNNDAIFRRR